jgi:methionine synthase II (cobalamin-independent)
MSLLTTTIGSLYRFGPDLHESIDQAIGFQRDHGLDIISDGEQRTDMVSYFAEALDGLAVEDGAPVVRGRIRLSIDPSEFSKVQDLDYIRSEHPDLKIKVAMTGPTTLGMTCGSRRITSHYRSVMDFSLYEDLAEALSPIAKALVERGAMVQVDEPFLSQGFKDLEQRVRLLDRIAEGLPSERMSVHVCGDVGRFGVVEHLLRLDNYSVLSFAFAGRVERGNHGHVSRVGFEDHGKRLGAGCIAVTPMSDAEVDRPEQVRSMLQELAGLVGRENIAYAHPDCGLRVTARPLVTAVLRNMRAGVDLFG